MRDDYIFRSSDKRFLDTETCHSGDESGSICLSLNLSKGRKYKNKDGTFSPRVQIEGNIKVADCSRSVSLDLWGDNENGIDLRLVKVRNMIESLQKLEAAMVGAIPKFNELISQTLTTEEATDNDDYSG